MYIVAFWVKRVCVWMYTSHNSMHLRYTWYTIMLKMCSVLFKAVLTKRKIVCYPAYQSQQDLTHSVLLGTFPVGTGSTYNCGTKKNNIVHSRTLRFINACNVVIHGKALLVTVYNQLSQDILLITTCKKIGNIPTCICGIHLFCCCWYTNTTVYLGKVLHTTNTCK